MTETEIPPTQTVEEFPKVLYRGSNYNTLSDHCYQLILQVTPEMGISILGPVQRGDHLFGLPRIDGGSEARMQPDDFQKVDPTADLFKVAAIQLLDEKTYPWLEPYHGTLFRAVGYTGTKGAYDDFSLVNIRALQERIRNNGVEGIAPDQYLDEEWARRKCIDQLSFGLKTNTIELVIDENVPSRTGDPCVRIKPASFIFCYLYSRTWKNVCPPGAEVKKVRISQEGEALIITTDISKNGEMLRSVYNRRTDRVANYQ